MKIATAEMEEDSTEAVKKNPAVVLGRRGGLARAKKLGVRRRKAIARAAASARWSKTEKTPK